MAVYEIIGDVKQDILLGTTNIADPILMMEIDGVPATGTYVVQQIGLSSRYIFPRVDVNGNIYLTSIAQTYGNDLPSVTFSINIYIAE